MATSEFAVKENFCEREFFELGECYHLWTPENFEIIFTCGEDFKVGMSIVGIVAKLFPDIRVLTFEIMSNHLHLTAAGRLQRILEMFGSIREMLRRYFKSKERAIAWDKFQAGTRLLETIEDVRNVIVYNNRNGYVVRHAYTPFTYPWGANRYYFNPDARKLAAEHSETMHIRELRRISHSRFADGIKNLMKYEGHALPTSFCDIKTGEALFRDPAHYFSKISRSIEADAKIAKEIGESVFYTDDDLYSAVCRMAAEKFSKLTGASGGTDMEHGHGAGPGGIGTENGRQISPTQLPAQAKLEIAKTMRFDYNASDKQIQRMLKLDPQIISSLLTKK